MVMMQEITPRRVTADPAVTYRVDQDAEPGNPLPALVRLLIGIRDKRRARAAEQGVGKVETEVDNEGRGK